MTTPELAKSWRRHLTVVITGTKTFQGIFGRFRPESRRKNGQGRSRPMPNSGAPTAVSPSNATPRMRRNWSAMSGSTITHTRGSSFAKSFGSASFAIAGEGAPITGHEDRSYGPRLLQGFRQSKDGNIVENHGGHGEMSTEVKVQQIASGRRLRQDLPRGVFLHDQERRQRTVGQERGILSEIEHVWLPNCGGCRGMQQRPG